MTRDGGFKPETPNGLAEAQEQLDDTVWIVIAAPPPHPTPTNTFPESCRDSIKQLDWNGATDSSTGLAGRLDQHHRVDDVLISGKRFKYGRGALIKPSITAPVDVLRESCG